MVVTTTSQAPGKELLEQLELTSEVRKGLTLSAKFMTNENHMTYYQNQYPLQARATVNITSLGKSPVLYIWTVLTCFFLVLTVLKCLYSVVRNIGLGTSSACARIGSFLALYVVWLVSNSDPALVIGIYSINHIVIYIFSTS